LYAKFFALFLALTFDYNLIKLKTRKGRGQYTTQPQN